MKTEILNFLAPVRSRLRTQSMISLLAPGATVGGAACVLLGLGRVLFGAMVTIPLLLSVFLGCIAVAAIVGYLLKRSWAEAASAVDTHYDLKDRTITALEFADQSGDSPLRELQLNDARQHLESVHPKDVVPFQAPKQWRWAVLSIAATTLLMLQPAGGNSLQAEVTSTEGITEAAAEIQEELAEMEELAEEAGIEELQKLVAELKEDLEELEKPDMEIRESLETISEMQQKMQEMMASMNVEAMDAQLADVAEAMAGAEAFKAAASALTKQDLDKAAKELENVNPENMERSESRPTSEKLAAAAASAKKKGMGKFSESLDELSESVKSGDCEGTCKNCDKLAKTVKKHGLCKSMCKMLESKCDKLGACKKLCSGNCNKAGNGACQGEGTNLAKGQTNQKSNNPSKKAGSKTAGNINGDKTKLDGELQMAKLTGKMSSDGESEFETESDSSPEGQGQAQRKAREAFAKYEKMSEAVLDSEPIPLGHRQTIRKYFELIRPTTEEAAALGEGADN